MAGHPSVQAWLDWLPQWFTLPIDRAQTDQLNIDVEPWKTIENEWKSIKIEWRHNLCWWYITSESVYGKVCRDPPTCVCINSYDFIDFHSFSIVFMVGPSNLDDNVQLIWLRPIIRYCKSLNKLIEIVLNEKPPNNVQVGLRCGSGEVPGEQFETEWILVSNCLYRTVWIAT